MCQSTETLNLLPHATVALSQAADFQDHGVAQPIANENMSRGFSRAYGLALGLTLRKLWEPHAALFRGPSRKKWDLTAAARGWRIRHYDEALTIHAFGES